MVNTSIRVVDLGKQYRIAGSTRRYSRLGDRVVDAIKAPIRGLSRVMHGHAPSVTSPEQPFWALKDVSFDIQHGEVVGIIGRNGAGKSTLLKILSRITDPTEGYADLFGRVGSLLEVGTGFHPELTGRENIFLNGAILGMRKQEIKSKFDEIVAFAEIEKFIDTPVKHYSSGMYVRLAFSVAAHLEPEILLVDEVLAVGDIAFQRKSLGKMDDVSKQGRTILFVSHNMAFMQLLCTRGIYIQNGRVELDGSIDQAIDCYLQTIGTASKSELAVRSDRIGIGHSKLVNVAFEGDNHRSVLKAGEPARLIFTVDRNLPMLGCSVYIYNQYGQPITYFRSDIPGMSDRRVKEMGRKIICEIDELLLLPGHYRMDVSVVGDNQLQDHIEGAAFFDVGEGSIGSRPALAFKGFSSVMPHRWLMPNNPTQCN